MRDRRCLSSSSSSDKWMSPLKWWKVLTIERKISPQRRGDAEKNNVCQKRMIRVYRHCCLSIPFCSSQRLQLPAVKSSPANNLHQTSYYKSSLAKIHFHYHSCVQRREAAAGYFADCPGLVAGRFVGICRDRRSG